MLNLTALSGSNGTTDGPALVWSVLLVVPLIGAAGNSLVVLAVVLNRSLHNSTNYLIMSLAVADLLISILVMPFAVYIIVNRLEWGLGALACQLWCVADVSASTASIVNLGLISVDRLFAVVRYAEYQTAVHQRRVNVAMVCCWLFSVGIGAPLALAFKDESVTSVFYCGIHNTDYMLYGSVCTFVVPCLVMALTYGYIFYAMQQRMRAVQLQEMAAGKFVGFSLDMKKTAHSAITGLSLPAAGVDQQLIAHLRQTVQQHQDGLGVLSEKDRRKLTALLEDDDPTTMELEPTPHVPRLPIPRLRRSTSARKTFADWALHMVARLQSNRGTALRKERRATKVVAFVMGLFLICWLPFFSLNIYKVWCLHTESWSTNLEILFTIFTWFGYANSCLNPLVYAVTNNNFRQAFTQLLHCECSTQQHKRSATIRMRSDRIPRRTTRRRCFCCAEGSNSRNREPVLEPPCPIVIAVTDADADRIQNKLSVHDDDLEHSEAIYV